MSQKTRKMLAAVVIFAFGVTVGIIGTRLTSTSGSSSTHAKAKHVASAPAQKVEVDYENMGSDDQSNGRYNPPKEKAAKAEYDSGYRDAVLSAFGGAQSAYDSLNLKVPSNVSLSAVAAKHRLNTLSPAKYSWFVSNPGVKAYITISKPLPQLATMKERLIAPTSNINFSWENHDFVVAVSRKHYNEVLAAVGITTKQVNQITYVTLSRRNAQFLLGNGQVPSEDDMYYLFPMR